MRLETIAELRRELTKESTVMASNFGMEVGERKSDSDATLMS